MTITVFPISTLQICSLFVYSSPLRRFAFAFCVNKLHKFFCDNNGGFVTTLIDELDKQQQQHLLALLPRLICNALTKTTITPPPPLQTLHLTHTVYVECAHF